MRNNEIARLGLIVVAACVFIFLIHTYNNDMGNNTPVESFYAEGEQTVNDPASQVPETNQETDEEALTESEGEVEPAEEDENEVFKTVAQEPVVEENANNNAGNNAANNAGNNAANNAGNNANRLPNECYPKDVLTPQDLLPQDANSTWAQTVPSGQGSLGDQNFLNAGFHVGINTVGQSLRNANLQLRSEPANPQLKVSPWLQTTIDPDMNRKAFEIGEV
jgi:hypothetical protein